MAGIHAACRTEQFDQIEDPRANLVVRPTQTKNTFHPKNFDRDIVAITNQFHIPFPKLASRSSDIGRPAYQWKNELNIGVGTRYRSEIGQLRTHNFQLAR